MSVATKIAGAQAAWDSDAEFRADALAIHNALKATGGLVQTSDTGQTDFTANTRASGGYTVYRFNDPDQTSYPLYLRIDWTPAATSRPGFSFTLGTGSNGSGTITGVTRTSYQISGGGSGTSAGLCDNYVSVGDGYLYVVLGVIAGAAGNQVACMLSIERSTGEDGTIHADEGIAVFATGANAKSYSIHPQGASANGPATGSPISSSISWAFWDDVAGADVAIMPAPYIIKGKVRFHRMAFARNGRVSYGVAFDATHMGATRKMMSIEQNYYYNSDANGWLVSNVAGPAIFIPWV
jgi:hypothetical protein